MVCKVALQSDPALTAGNPTAVESRAVGSQLPAAHSCALFTCYSPERLRHLTQHDAADPEEVCHKGESACVERQTHCPHSAEASKTLPSLVP